MCRVKLCKLLGLFRLACVPLMLIFASMQLFAQQDLEKPPEIPPADTKEQALPPKVQDEQIEPTVTIHEEKEGRVEEYSLNGQVYMVKVTPKAGPAYYYIDTDGDGVLETAPSKGLEPVHPVYWKLKEWK